MRLSWTRMVWFAAALCGVVSVTGCRAAERAVDTIGEVFTAAPERLGMADPLRGVWVTRWDYITADDVRTIMRDASQMGFTDVFWQVRGQADAYYESRLEPWGQELFRDGNDDKTPPTEAEVRKGPGYDPLEVAVREAHRRGMRIHAWMNVMPLWKGKVEPVSASHPWRSHRSWRLKDDRGVEQPLSDEYVIANPVLEDVQDHIVSVVRDIVSRYEVDGIHLDYIRFISESLEKDRWYPGDAVSRALFRQAKGLSADAKVDPAAMRAWVRDRISDLVHRIREEAVNTREGVTLSAAVWRRPEMARDQQLQDAARWANLGWVDVLMPMLYTDNDAQFSGDLRAWEAAVHRRGAIAPGIGVYKHDSGRQTLGQVKMHDDDKRFVLFAYSSLFHSRAPGSADTPQAESERLKRRVPLRTIMHD
ncbi:MAG: family 10 glycosylhydrolase [Phycisphaeraceae bacterium]|nr:MAG: family 10 glycosylhydrolase [Phycisphaeraceae bacterium]